MFQWFKEWKIEMIIGFIIILICTVIAIVYYRDTTIRNGIVVGKEYSPSGTSVGTGVNSQGGIVTVVNSKSEDYIILIKGLNLNGKNKISSVKVSVEEYLEYEVGDTYHKED